MSMFLLLLFVGVSFNFITMLIWGLLTTEASHVCVRMHAREREVSVLQSDPSHNPPHTYVHAHCIYVYICLYEYGHLTKVRTC